MKRKGLAKVIVLVLPLLQVGLVRAQTPEDSGPRVRIIEVGLRGVLPSQVSWNYCEQVGNKFKGALDEIFQIVSDCKDNTQMQPNSPRDIGPACRQWAGSAGGSWWCVSLHPRCVDAEEGWYRASLERERTMSTCYKRAAENGKNEEDARTAFDRERWFYNHTFDFARKWQLAKPVQDKIIETSMNEIQERHNRVLDELDQLIDDMEDFK